MGYGTISIAATKELEIIRKNNKGFLKPEDVIDHARNKKSALHNRFTWDDTEAAHQYRMEQARRIIRVAVVVSEEDGTITKAYVSLSTERDKGEIGYRAIAQVIDNKILRERLIKDCYDDMKFFRDKYSSISKIAELKPVFKVIDSVIEKTKK